MTERKLDQELKEKTEIEDSSEHDLPPITVSSLKLFAQKQTIKPGVITVFVGPNNSGKSQALRDIKALCTAKEKEGYYSKVVKEIELDGLPNTKEETQIAFPGQCALSLNEANPPEWVCSVETYSTESGFLRFSQEDYAKIYDKDEKDRISTKKYLMPNRLVHLTGKDRFYLVSPRKSAASFFGTHLRLLSGVRLNKLNEIIYEFFSKYIIPVRNGSNSCILKVSDSLPDFELMPSWVSTEELEKQNKFYNNCPLLEDEGDGIQAAVGILSALLVMPQTILLIDEPEAFLSPSLARKLADKLTRLAKERRASLFISTHSSDFLMGCVETSKKEEENDLKIVRLTHKNGFSTAHEVPWKTVKEFDTNPALRSSAAIDGLFHKGTIVTEGHRDRVFYDEAARIFGLKDRKVIDSGGGFKQIHKTIGPLREMGVVAAAIVDFDFLLDTDEDARTSLYKSLNITSPVFSDSLDRKLKDFLEKKPKCSECGGSKEGEKHPAKKGGVKWIGFSSKDKKELTEILVNLHAKGLFIVPYGELENWLELKKGRDWDANWLSRLHNQTPDELKEIESFYKDIKRFFEE